MTVAEAIRAATTKLSATSDTARLDAELLMAHALGISRSDLLLRWMNGPVPQGFEALVDRRIVHEPVAYITGRMEFHGLELAVTPAILIPRPDSEVLVETALERTREEGRALDLGTGSGALLLAFLMGREKWTGIAIDASDAALRVALGNATALGLSNRVDWQRRDWHDSGWRDRLGRFDLILCNPPYVEKDADLEPDVRDFEPHSALFSGPEGLDDYRVLIPQMRDLMTENGLAVFEIGAAQAESVSDIARIAGFEPEIRKDLANRPRVIVLHA